MEDKREFATDDLYAIKDINLYSVLCITKETFTPEIAKKKYRKLIIKYHPDKNADVENAEEKFQMLHLAYSILSDPEKKSMYDYVYTSSQEIEDFETLKDNNTEYFVERVTDDEFNKKIRNLNLKVDENYYDNNNKLSENELNEMIKNERQEELLPTEMQEKFKSDLDMLEGITDDDERQKMFNQMFETAATNNDNDNTDMMLYNGNTDLMNMGIASTSNYDTMYSDVNTYDDAFQINRVDEEELDSRSYADQMKDYHAQLDNLDEISKHSKLNNGRADFGSDYV